MFCLVRLATACMDFFPSEGDVPATELAASANVLAPLAALIFFLTGCLYSFSEIGGLAWILSISPDGSKGWTMAAMMSARMSGALLGVSEPLTNDISLVLVFFFHPGPSTTSLSPRPLIYGYGYHPFTLILTSTSMFTPIRTRNHTRNLLLPTPLTPTPLPSLHAFPSPPPLPNIQLKGAFLNL